MLRPTLKTLLAGSTACLLLCFPQQAAARTASSSMSSGIDQGFEKTIGSSWFRDPGEQSAFARMQGLVSRQASGFMIFSALIILVGVNIYFGVLPPLKL